MVGAHAIFLDAGRDRYFSIGGATALGVQALLERRSVDKGALDRLGKAGLVEAGEPEAPWPRLPIPPARSFM